ncbi:MAG: EcsC family protein [Cellulosilyticaceae bacterium]
MKKYEQEISVALMRWKSTLRRPPSMMEKASKGVQIKINSLYPEKYHQLLTKAIKQMTEAVLTGSEYTTPQPRIDLSLRERDRLAREVSNRYKTVAMVEGAGTGAGGIMLGLADFPLLLGIKMKVLYEIAAIYGFNVKDYTERIYILSIFELAFSSQEHTIEVLERMENWDSYKHTVSEAQLEIDWRRFQQEYRDYLDLAKLMQMLPFIGAPVGAYVNSKLLKKLSYTAMQAYRMRWIHN